jgi:hypothetical protein
MSSNVRERRVVVVHPRVDVTSTGGTAASGTVHSDGAKNGSETAQAPSPWPVEFGWDFPFDFPKPTR